jgi:AraC-like DNA-binding protein
VDANARTWASLREIAEGCGLERSSVCRLFRRFAGVTPGRYLMRRKMNLAAAHLIEHGGWVKEAAAYVGLADPLHFSRCFRQVHGVPPSALLRRGLKVPAETKPA